MRRPLQRRPLFDLLARRQRLHGGHRLADFLNHLLDIAGIAQNALQPLDHFGLVADVALHDVHGVVQNIVDRQGHGAVNGLDAFLGGVGLFDRQQLQRVQGQRPRRG